MADAGDTALRDPSNNGKCEYPYPPELPGETLVETGPRKTKYPADWNIYFARLGSSGEGFHVRSEHENELKSDERDKWPYRLGPPVASVECSAVIEQWGLQVLEAAGFINCKQALNVDMNPMGGPNYVNRNPKLEEDKRIHPVLWQDMFTELSKGEKPWPVISDDDYKAITPSVLLAGALLDQESTLNFFYAVSTPSCHTKVADPHDETKTQVHIKIPDRLTEEQQGDTYWKIVYMRKWTRWRVDNMLDKMRAHIYGCTSGHKKDEIASAPSTRQSRIRLSSSRLDLLHAYNRLMLGTSNDYEVFFGNIMKKLGVAEDRQIDFDLESANFRVMFLLARTMFHEFAHAFCMAYVSSSDGIEPWIADNISNEMGYALEKYVLGGCPTPNVVIDHSSMNNEDHAQQKDHAPFGLSFAENWDLWRPESKRELRKSPINQDLTNVVYPLPQRHIHELFGNELWTQKVDRFGTSAVKLPKLQRWKVSQDFEKHWIATAVPRNLLITMDANPGSRGSAPLSL